MVFRDMLLRCGACGKEFVYTVREQRQRQQLGLPSDPPAFCSDCRVADVRLAEAAGPPLVDQDTDPYSDPYAPSSPYMADVAPEPSRAPTGERPQSANQRGRGGARDRSQGRPPARGGGRGREEGRGGGAGGRKAPRSVQTELRVRHVGAVKYFNSEKGYGFIASEDEGEVFVHLSGLLDSSMKVLEVGSPVEFEIEHTARGPQAVDVIPLA